MYIHVFFIVIIEKHLLCFKYAGYKKKVTPIVLMDFTLYEDVQECFQTFTSVITHLLSLTSISFLRRACILQSSGPSSIKLPSELAEKIKEASDIESLMNELVFSGFWSWIDTRLVEAMAAATNNPETRQLVKDYKSFVHGKKISEILPNFPGPQTKDQYIERLTCKLNKFAGDVTVKDLLNFKSLLETVILDINEGSLRVDKIKEGCIEMCCYISDHLFTHAYQSSLKKTNKFSSLHIRYLDFKGYPRIYSLQGTKQMYGSSSLSLPPTGMLTN